MATQSEAALENGLIKTLMDNSYERVFIKEEEKSGRLDEEKDENSFSTIFCVLRWNSDCKHIF